MQIQSIQSARLSVQSSELGPTTPSSPGECCPPPPLEGDTLAFGEGVGAPIPTKGHTLWYSVYTIIPLRGINFSFGLENSKQEK
jgi:hypothetical protein